MAAFHSGVPVPWPWYYTCCFDLGGHFSQGEAGKIYCAFPVMTSQCPAWEKAILKLLITVAVSEITPCLLPTVVHYIYFLCPQNFLHWYEKYRVNSMFTTFYYILTSLQCNDLPLIDVKIIACGSIPVSEGTKLCLKTVKKKNLTIK